jgi:hypothetical protein
MPCSHGSLFSIQQLKNFFIFSFIVIAGANQANDYKVLSKKQKLQYKCKTMRLLQFSFLLWLIGCILLSIGLIN